MTDKTEAMDNLIAQDADLIDTNDKDSAVLLPCPFCGKQPWSYDDANHSTAWEVECGNTTCSAQPSVWKTTKVEAIAAWNTRQPTQSDALREENERLREHLISALDTLKDAEVCDDNCGPCNEARAALEQSK
ncbi:Restriction alleviation protein Lar [uncultured Caudovirales phage]|uniref:Restriction alleviation protein Lar n=1 Tax=uncultured Caudovirales phage TaxID=2100421 RepID=A0A6J5N122_9CAUD|nr:Restriction alleviation protein Lar [uncultured Caudovirales phage]